VLSFEELEPRWIPNASAGQNGVTVSLDPTLDQTGGQIFTSQGYVDSTRSSYAIFDTGSPVVSFSAVDQARFTTQGDPIPVKVPGGASANLLGGGVDGDVSQPGVIHVAGASVGLSAAPSGGTGFVQTREVTLGGQGLGGGTGSGGGAPLGPGNGGNGSGGIQVFIGTARGSPNLPTLAGTPILSPCQEDPSGLAALVTMGGTTLGFYSLPGLALVSPGTPLPATSATDIVVQVPLTLSGQDNLASPGGGITTAPVPVQTGVQLVDNGASIGQQRFLFDTGSQITVISTAEAAALGLKLSSPDGSMQVSGAGGIQSVPSFTLSELDVPLANGGTLRFTNVSVAVLDLADGFDGILGMNLLNQASEFIYDPYGSGGATLSISFASTRQAAAGQTGGQGSMPNPTLTGMSGAAQLPGFEFNNAQISGRVFLDFNANGAQDPHEPGVAGVKVFLDLAGDGKLDPGDPVCVTNSVGGYTFANLASQTYTVREQLPDQLIGLDLTASQTVSVHVGSATTIVNFADQARVQTANETFVSELYGTILDRAPDAGGMKTWVNLLESGTPSSVVVTDIWQSPEHRGLEIQGYYQAFLHRSAEGAGLRFWVSQFQAGANEATVERGILSSAEYQSSHPDNASFVAGLYQDILGRPADAAGLNSWLTALGSGASRAFVIEGLLTSSEDYRRLVEQYYGDFLHRSADASGEQFWLALLQQGRLTPAEVAIGFLDSGEFFTWAGQTEGI
jgi:hypothetical protein